MNISKLKLLAPIYVVAGALGAWLYRLIYLLARDERELIIRWGLPEIALWVLTAVVLVSALVPARKIKFTANGNPPILGCIAYACGIFSLTLSEALGPAPLVILYRVMIWASIASLILSVVLRCFRIRHSFLLDLCPCVLCILHLVECYQLWSEMPLMLDYFFPLGAVLCAALFFYENLALRAGMPMKGMYLFSALAGIFFCCVATTGKFFPVYFPCVAVYMAAMLFVPRAEEENAAA